ncbi:hypothetical protein K9L05_01535 [Candidatus Babeliales bacterium]|nr:hypothetical protein [Candidatus Babeliales bacterium]MCF7899313.1 hypothetical protein [Candidatus Babeliales bacterium]
MNKFFYIFILIFVNNFCFSTNSSELFLLKFKVSLGKNKAILKDNIMLSCDNPKIFTKNWQIKAEPVSEYLPEFRRNKKIFTHDLDIELKLKILNKDSNLDKLIKKSKIFLSYFVLDFNGKIRPKMFIYGPEIFEIL